jgi:anti-repressor protein
MQELIKVQVKNDQQLVSGRELYKFLEIETQYTKWFSRMCEYGFSENIDYVAVSQKRLTAQGNQTTFIDHDLTVNMAEQISMLQRNNKGRQAREYFIQVEQKWNNPAEVIRRGYALAQEQAKKLTLENANLAIQNLLMKPKADYFDDLVKRKKLVNLSKTAKMLKIKRKDFINWLLDNKYLYRDAHNDLMPYEKYSNNYFEVKDSRQGFPQTLITPKGREEFNLLINHEKELQT